MNWYSWVETISCYFPSLLGKKYGKDIENHRLRREIIATVVTNSMVNRVGGTFVHEFAEKTGMAPSVIARAYVTAPSIWTSPRRPLLKPENSNCPSISFSSSWRASPWQTRILTDS